MKESNILSIIKLTKDSEKEEKTEERIFRVYF